MSDPRDSLVPDGDMRPDDTGRHLLKLEERLSGWTQKAASHPAPVRPASGAMRAVAEATPDQREVVLVVDDDDLYVAIWRRSLSRDGVDLHIAANMEEGLAVLGTLRTLAVAVLDWQLPNGDGVHVAESVVEKFPHARIIVASGYDSIERPNLPMRERFLAVAPHATFEPKHVAVDAVRRDLRTPPGGTPIK